MSTLPFCLVTVLRFQNWKSSHLGLMSSTVLWQASIGLFIQLSCFSCVYISIFKVNSTFLSWCYGLALSGLKSWHLGLKLQVFNYCLWTTRKRGSIHSVFIGSFDITRCLEAWRVEQHSSVSVSWRYVEAIGNFERLEDSRNWTWPAMSLEGGRISPQIVHLESIKTSCWLLEHVVALRQAWSLYDLKIVSTRPWNIKSFNLFTKYLIKSKK